MELQEERHRITADFAFCDGARWGGGVFKPRLGKDMLVHDPKEECV